MFMQGQQGIGMITTQSARLGNQLNIIATRIIVSHCASAESTYVLCDTVLAQSMLCYAVHDIRMTCRA
jgi:hypothetical protein